MQKYDFIHNLKNIKLVIGNGFDLNCGLKTKYSDYFNFNKEKIKNIKEWITFFKNYVRDYLRFSDANHKSSWKEFNYINNYNIWDFFFCIVSDINGSNYSDWQWCDIEKEMESSLVDSSNKKDDYLYKWKYVNDILHGKLLDCDEYVYILAAVIYKKNREEIFLSDADFYAFLLSELKTFETEFGLYIATQYYEPNNLMSGRRVLSNMLKMNAEYLIDELCNINNLVSIDSFNYGFLNMEKTGEIFHNINGNIDYPIFGIDSSLFIPSDPQYIFCKTNRRMELDMLEYELQIREDFENIIVYGHSLTISDYSYYFPLFDKIDLLNNSKKSVIVFAYSVYDKSAEDKIKSSYRLAISNLFQEYSKYKGTTTSPNRLLDSLTTQGKVLLYEID